MPLQSKFVEAALKGMNLPSKVPTFKALQDFTTTYATWADGTGANPAPLRPLHQHFGSNVFLKIAHTEWKPMHQRYLQICKIGRVIDHEAATRFNAANVTGTSKTTSDYAVEVVQEWDTARIDSKKTLAQCYQERITQGASTLPGFRASNNKGSKKEKAEAKERQKEIAREKEKETMTATPVNGPPSDGGAASASASGGSLVPTGGSGAAGASASGGSLVPTGGSGAAGASASGGSPSDGPTSGSGEVSAFASGGVEIGE
jgi:hypothetical protein